MSFLRRIRPQSSSTADPWAVTPEWANPITPGGFRRIASIVQHEVGRDRLPDQVALRDETVAVDFGLPALVPVFADTEPERWEALLHHYLTTSLAFRAAGDAVEARSQTFEAAAEVLRIHWIPARNQPPGDVAIDGPVADTVEVLALDAGSSIRYVSERLLAGWGVSIDEAVRTARERVLGLRRTPLDLAAQGSPQVRGLSLEDEGPFAGALFHALEQVAPDAIGLFGTLVGAPVGNALLWRALDPGPDLAGDLVQLAFFTYTFAEQAEAGFLRMPVWRRPDGRSVTVTLQLTDRGSLLGSHHPGFDGVLAALDLVPVISVPGWARAAFDGRGYTRFAGCIAAERDIKVEDVAQLGSAWSLAGLAADCARVPFPAWPALVAGHLAGIDASDQAAQAIVTNAGVDPGDVLRHLVTWLDVRGQGDDRATQPVAGTRFVEVLGVHAADHAVPVPARVAAGLGEVAQLFDAAAARVRATLAVDPEAQPMLAADARWVTGDPSPMAAAPRLAAWLPEVCGPHGALVALGAADRLLVEPITDASVVLDLPELISHAAGGASRAPWALPPCVIWVGPDGVDALDVEVADGQVQALRASRDLRSLIAALPVEPVRMPPGLTERLGTDGARHFYALLQASILARLETAPADLVPLTPILVSDIAAGLAGDPRDRWPGRIEEMLDEAAAPRLVLDGLAHETDYAGVAPSLHLRLARPRLAGSELVKEVPGGLVAYPVLEAGPRHRRVTREMLERWGVTPDRCHADALANTAWDPGLVDEAMFPDNPAVRELYCEAAAREAAALGLHLRHRGSRRGFVVSITHGSRAHYVMLDDPRGIPSVPIFAGIMAEIYRAADAAADAQSSWLLWLRPDGTATALFDVLEPLPDRDRLPPDFVAMVDTGTIARPN